MYDRHTLHSCLEEPIYRYDVEPSLTMRFAEYLTDYGALSKPLASKPLARMETEGFVLIASLRTDQFRLRFKTTGESDIERTRTDIERALEQYIQDATSGALTGD